MLSTDVFGYPCIGEEDYAGVPIFMKSLAERIESTLSGQQAALDSFMDTGSAIWAATATQTFPDGFTTTVNSINTQIGGAGLAQPVTGVASLPPLRGWYYFGGNLTAIPLGALTPASIRVFSVVVTTLGLIPGTQQLAIATTRVIGKGAPPGDAMWCDGTVFHDGLSTAIVEATVYHDQAAVDIQSTLTPAPRIFIAYLGDSPDIKEVA
jgi:hypothetical protein